MFDDYEDLDFCEGPDEKYRGGCSIESFTEGDMDRALARFDVNEGGEFTTQSSTHDGFWRPTNN